MTQKGTALTTWIGERTVAERLKEDSSFVTQMGKISSSCKIGGKKKK